MSVCSGSAIRCDSLVASAESNRHSSTLVPCSEKSAKFTPSPSQVAPSGYGLPGQTISSLCLSNETSREEYGGRAAVPANLLRLAETGPGDTTHDQPNVIM